MTATSIILCFNKQWLTQVHLKMAVKMERARERGTFYCVKTDRARDDRGGDNWSYKTCSASVKSSPPTNQHPAFYTLDVLPVAQPTVSKHWREKESCSMNFLTSSSSGVFILVLIIKGSWLCWPLPSHRPVPRIRKYLNN